MPTKKKITKKKLSPTASKLRKKWIEALRSGKYRQTTASLCNIENGKRKYCCLGVLCKVVGLHEEKYPGFVIFNHSANALPNSLRRQVNLTSKQEDNLIWFNDVEKLTFKQIADRIENNDFSLPKSKEGE